MSTTSSTKAKAAAAAKADNTAAQEADRLRTERRLAREAALATAKAAEEEAAAAQRDRDAADARIREALQRAAKARTEAPVASDEEDCVDDDDIPELDARHALAIHEAQALLHLHSQAVAVQNIRLLIPVVLDHTAKNYARWREQFLLVVGKYSLQDHVLRDPPLHTHPDWVRMDCVVRS
jgi:hypothetical protein